MTAIALQTPHGPARAHVEAAADRTNRLRRSVPRAALVLGHGAGGGVAARDLAAAASAAREAGLAVALVEQPYRVAGRRSAPAASTLDAAWTAAVEQLLAGELAGLALVAGGRSSGARVACRTAKATGAIGVLCLAFPLQPPARRSTGAQAPSRLPELDAAGVPVLVVQGERDRFGMPPPGPQREVVQVSGDHALRTDLDAVGAAVGRWLRTLAGARR